MPNGFRKGRVEMSKTGTVDKRERHGCRDEVNGQELIRKHLSPEPGKFENKRPID